MFLQPRSEETQKAIQESLKTQNQREPMEITSEDAQLSRAIEMSMKDQPYIPDFENPDMKMRKEGVPVGLKNVGNSTRASG